MMQSKWTFIVATMMLFLFFEGCSLSEPEIKMQKKPYFALDSLLNQEIAYLQKQGAGLTKIYTIQGSDESETKLAPTEIDWDNEFALFQSKDINKSALVGRYVIESKNQTLIYRLKEDEEGEVKVLKVFLDADQSVKRLEIEALRNNYVEQSQWLLTLAFDGHIKSYTVKQDQKLTFKAQRSFQITSFVTIP